MAGLFSVFWKSHPFRTGGRIFQQSNIPGLSNGDRLPFMTVANCWNGEFSDSTRDRVLAEEFLLVENKGGIAAWAPSSLAFPTINTLMYETLFEALFVDDDLILGSAATTARINAHLQDPALPLAHIETFTYFGDLALGLLMPGEPVASFTSSAPNTLGQTTAFQCTSKGTILSLEWDFGDGSPLVNGLEHSVSHT
jgi:hypothetical protein